MSKYVGYNNQSIINISSNDVGTKLLDKLSRISDDRRIQPLDKYDYIPYKHRSYYNEYNLQIGDCSFMIPPEFIMVSAESTTQSIITLRQENTQKEKHGHHRRTILIDLVFNGVDNLNGFEVDAPSHPDGSGGTSKKYYVDGLRQLMAQFKCAPFLPISNILINRTYGIYTVALQSITISTVNGFPDCMKAQVTLQEVNMMPYLEVPDIAFSSMIDWDLFRYYYQSFLTEKHKYKRLQSLPKDKNFNRFKLSILDQTIFLDGKVTDGNILDVCLDSKVYGENGTNYITWIDSETDGVNIKEFQCGYSNILTNIQFAELSTPTLQYLGGMDTIYNITFETTNELVIQKIEQCQTVNDLLIRNNPKLQGSIGFVKLESELTEFTGALFVMIDSVSTNTVPGFPDLYNVQINCVAYDIAQSEREDLNGFRPFDDYLGTGTGLDQSATYANETIYNGIENGLLRKIKQDNYAEWKLSQMEVYPDLRLPTYGDVDSMISNISSFRSKNGLSPLPYSKYPSRPASSLHGFNPNNPPSVFGDMPKITSIARSDYHKYVDPDFYVFYPNSHNALNGEYNDIGIKEPKQQTGYTKHITEYNFPTDTPVGTTNGSEIGGTNSALVEKFIKCCTDQIGHTYIWGAEGEVSDSKGLCFDCSGLIHWALKQCGITPKERFTTSTIPNNTDIFTKIDRNSAQRGDILLRPNQHVAVYLGNNEVMHAKGSKYGCLKESLSTAGNFAEAYRINAFSGSGDAGSATSNNSTGFHATDEFVGMVAQWEGFLGKATPKDGGMDIGYGFHNQFTENGKTVKVTSGMTMTKERADKILKEMLNGMISQTVAKLQRNGWNPSDFTNNQVLALTSYFFNRGFSNSKADQILNKTNSPTISAIGNNLPNYWGSASYAKTGLINRRNKEKALFFSGSDGASSDDAGGTGGSSGPTLTTAEFNAICQKVKQAVGSEGSDAEVAMAQLIYDRLTSGNYGSLSNVLNSIDVSSSMIGGSSSTVASNVQAVFCSGKKAWSQRALWTLDNNKPIAEYDRYDKAHQRRGAAGKHMFWGDGENSSDIKYTITDATNGGGLNNDGSVEEKTIEVDTYSLSSTDDFGEPVLIRAESFNDRSGGKKKYQNDLNNAYNAFNSSFHDQYQYSCRGRLVRAFPAFLFCLLDDDAAWYDGRKLWTNYYTHKSVIDIQVHATNDMSMDTATIVVTNTYHNLDRTESGISKYDLMKDPEINGFAKWLYKNTGLAFGAGAKLTSMMIQLHQVIYTHARLREGARAHLRMGYGSDPLSLAPMINGTVTDCAVGDQISLVISSDGSELVACVTSAKENDTNNGWLGLFGLGEDQEGSNIIANIMCARQSWMSYISSDWFEGSKYSIEHYGLYFGQSLFGSNGEAGPGVIGDTAIGAGAGALVGSIVPGIGTAIGAGVGALVGFGVSILTGGGGGSMKVNVADLWDGYSEQFDLLMNIYRANYKGDLYIHEGALFGADGETNVVFNKFNMTPWDVFQTCTQNVPEYIMKTGYHQFDSRLYYGLPFFMERFRYDYFGNSYGNIYQEAKTASQVHFIDSMDCIVDNQMRVSAKTTYTNIKVMYLRGSSSTSTMLIHSDDTIDNSKQKTKILDTPIVQDALGPDFLYEILGYKVGHDSARRTGISNLIYGWQGQYQGQIICTGCPGIKPHDHLLMNDSYSEIFGLCICREVVHSFSTNTGYCTSIVPGMVAMSTDQNSAMTESVRSYLGLLSCFSAYTYARKGMYSNYEAMIGALSDAYVLEETVKSNILHSSGYHLVENVHAGARNIGGAIFTAYVVRKLLKGGLIFKEVVAYARWAKKAVQAAGFGIKTIKAIATGAEIAGVGAAPETCGFSLILTLAAWLLVDVLLDALFEWLDNKNTIVLLPLWREGYPFVTNVKDGKHILLCPSNSTATEDYEDH